MSLRASATHLSETMKALTQEWQRTQESWNDIKSRTFEQDYLAELPQQIARALTAMEELDGVLRKIKSACE